MPAPIASPTAQPRRSVERMRNSDIGPSWSATRNPSPNPTTPECTRSWSQPARLGSIAQLVRDDLVRAFGPVAQQRPRVARVDDLLDAEALGGAKRRAHRVQARLDLGAQRVGVLGGLELAPVRGLEPPGDRQRPPVAARPRVAQVQRGVVAVARARDAVDLADEDAAPRD